VRSRDTYEKAIADCSRTGDWSFREEFIAAAGDAIWRAASPAEAWRTLWRYHRRCKTPMERAIVLREGERIHMWETMPHPKLSAGNEA
jgi:hypothetical protein